MKRNSLLPVAAAGCLTMISAGCANLDRRAIQAATVQGQAEARVTLPALPEDCRKQEAHAALTAGTEIRSILRRERAALDRANARVLRCAGNYDGVAKALK